MKKIEEGKSGQAVKADSLEGFGEGKRCFGAVGLAWGIFWFGRFGGSKSPLRRLSIGFVDEKSCARIFFKMGFGGNRF